MYEEENSSDENENEESTTDLSNLGLGKSNSAKKSKSFKQLFMKFSFTIKDSIIYPNLLDGLIFAIVHIRLILWPIFIVSNSENWNPTYLASFFNIICGLLTEPLTYSTNSYTIFYLLCGSISLIFVHTILELLSCRIKYIQEIHYINVFIYVLSGLVKYSFLPFFVRLFSLIYDCNEIPDISCKDTIRQLFMAFCGLVLPILAIDSAYFAIINFDSKILSTNIFHRTPSSDMIFFWFMQLILSVLWTYIKIQGDTPNLIHLYIILCFYVAYAFVTNHYRYYYSARVTMFVRLFSIYMLSSVIVATAFIHLKWTNSYPVLFIWIFCMIFVTIWFIFDESHLLKIGGDLELNLIDLRFFVYEAINTKNSSRGINLQLQGYAFAHNRFCNDMQCMLKEANNMIITENDKTIDKQLKTMFIRYISYKFGKDTRYDPFNSDTRLEKAQFTLEILQNCQRAKLELSRVKSKGIMQEIWKHTLMENVLNFDFNNNSGLFDDNKQEISKTDDKQKMQSVFIQLGRIEERLSETTCRSADSCYRLWNYMGLARPKLDIAEQLIVEAYNNYQLVLKVWKEVEELPYIPAILRRIYAMYLRDVLGDYAQFEYQIEMYFRCESIF